MPNNPTKCPVCGQVTDSNREYKIGEKRLITLKCGHFMEIGPDSLDGSNLRQRSVDLDDDVYGFIKTNVRDFGESVSTVLRRLLQIPAVEVETVEPPSEETHSQMNGRVKVASLSLVTESPLIGFVSDPGFRRGTATDRFLRALGFVYKEDPTRFERVFEISGRSRKYFGRSEQEIEKSGTHPRQIPGSEYWAMTNADTRQKCDVLETALRSLGYAVEEIRAAVKAVC